MLGLIATEQQPLESDNFTKHDLQKSLNYMKEVIVGSLSLAFGIDDCSKKFERSSGSYTDYKLWLPATWHGPSRAGAPIIAYDMIAAYQLLRKLWEKL